MQLLHWAPAHTSGDLVVYVPAEKLVLAGDILVIDQHNPSFDSPGKGGSSRGWVESVQGMLKLDADRYVLGHEGVVGKDVLRQQLSAAVTERQRVKELYDKGMSLRQIQITVGDPAPVPAGVVPQQHGPNFPPFSEVLYRELKEGLY